MNSHPTMACTQAQADVRPSEASAGAILLLSLAAGDLSFYPSLCRWQGSAQETARSKESGLLGWNTHTFVSLSAFGFHPTPLLPPIHWASES